MILLQLVHVLANTVVVIPFMNWDVGIRHSFEENPNDLGEQNCDCLLKRSVSVSALDNQNLFKGKLSLSLKRISADALQTLSEISCIWGAAVNICARNGDGSPCVMFAVNLSFLGLFSMKEIVFDWLKIKFSFSNFPFCLFYVKNNLNTMFCPK